MLNNFKSSRAQTTCDKPEFIYLGDDVILNVPVRKYRVIRNGDNRTETTVWFAPSLSCQFLRDVTVARDDRGGEASRYTREATSITLGEPSAANFAVPPGLKEVRPSELAALSFRTASNSPNAAVPECVRRGGELQDKRYEEAKKLFKSPE
jgi:hypothetical protein